MKTLSKCIFLYITSYKDIKSIFTIGNLYELEKEKLIKDDWSIYDKYAMGRRVIVRWHCSQEHGTINIRYIICKMLNPQQWQILIHDRQFYTCGVAKWNSCAKRYNVGHFVGPWSELNKCKPYFYVREYYSVWIQFIMCGQLQLTCCSFTYRT